MSNYNKVILMGNLTRDPEVRFTRDGSPVASFTLAINNRYKQENETREDVSYIDVVTFGKQADLVKNYLEKGSPVLIEGRLQQRRWEQEGQKRSKVEVVTQTITFVGSGRRSGSSSASAPEEESGFQGFSPEAGSDGDIPF
ncbi:MAG: single-stranded DNA-binding protein [Nitrospirae bacterium]|nr:single-stranded DNA-binding protein [Nitrospirota bacterium]